MILPGVTLALFFIAVYARLTRAAVMEVRATGLRAHRPRQGTSGFAVGSRHILRNALLPVTTLAGMHIGGVLGGAVVVETVFSWPGLGGLPSRRCSARDYSVLLGMLLLSSLLVIIVNILVDLLHAWLDPRIEVR